MGVNAASFVHYWLNGKSRTVSDFLVPTFGFLSCAFIWVHLSRPAMLIGVIWMAGGIAYGAVRTRGFRSKLVTFDIPIDEI